MRYCLNWLSSVKWFISVNWFRCVDSVLVSFRYGIINESLSQRPRGLRRGSAAAHLLGLWVRISEGVWMCAFCECCMLSGRGLCAGPIIRREQSYRLWCVWIWSSSLDNGKTQAPRGCYAMGEKNYEWRVPFSSVCKLLYLTSIGLLYHSDVVL